MAFVCKQTAYLLSFISYHLSRGWLFERNVEDCVAVFLELIFFSWKHDVTRMITEAFKKLGNDSQCPKLRVHPAPGAHISAAGCTIFRGVHPECTRLFEILSLIHIRRVHSKNPGCRVFRSGAPGGCTKQNLNFGHCSFLKYFRMLGLITLE